MVLVRLAYVADLPAPAELVRRESLDAGNSGAAVRGDGPAPAPRRIGRRPPPGERSGREAVDRTSPAPAGAAAALAARGRGSCAAALARPDAASQARAVSRGRARPDAAEFRRGRRAVRPASRGADALASVVAMCISSQFEPGRIEFRPGRGRAARPRQPARAAAGRVDRNALGGRGFAGRGRADPAQQQASARRPLRNEVAATRWCGRCSRPFRARRSRRCGSASPRPIAAPSGRAETDEDRGDAGHGRGQHEEYRPADEAGAADAGEDGRDAGAARGRRDDRGGRRRHGPADAERQGRSEKGRDRQGGARSRKRSRCWRI